jgi:hypothetical protein
LGFSDGYSTALCSCSLGYSESMGSLEQLIDTSQSYLLLGECRSFRSYCRETIAWTTQLRSFVAGGKRSLYVRSASLAFGPGHCWGKSCIYIWASRLGRRFVGHEIP